MKKITLTLLALMTVASIHIDASILKENECQIIEFLTQDTYEVDSDGTVRSL
jgi:hypothetical protein